MKKHTILSTLLLCFGATMAQITVERTNLPYTGTFVYAGSDTSSDIPLQTGGPAKTWDLSTLENAESMKYKFVNKDWALGNQNFPVANMAYYDELSADTSITYVKLDNTQMSWSGFYEVFQGQTSAFKINIKQAVFPLNSNSSWASQDSSFQPAEYLGQDFDGAGPLPAIDSVKMLVKMMGNGKTVGFGNLKIPLGTYPALMVEQLIVFKPVMYMYTNKKWRIIPQVILALMGGAPEADSTIQHSWYTNASGIKFPLLTYSFTPGDENASDITFVTANAEVSNAKKTNMQAVKVFPNPGYDQVHLTGMPNASQAKFFSSTGSVCKVADMTAGNVISTRDLVAGIYSIQLLDKQGNVLTVCKWVKQ